jgi:hypothetical protein
MLVFCNLLFLGGIPFIIVGLTVILMFAGNPEMSSYGQARAQRGSLCYKARMDTIRKRYKEERLGGAGIMLFGLILCAISAISIFISSSPPG